MSMTYTTTEAARGRDADWERRHGPSASDVTTVWDFDGGQSLELTVGELEEYEQAEGVTLDEDIIGPQRFASLLEWLREEELLEQPIHGSPVTDEEMADENARPEHTPGSTSVSRAAALARINGWIICGSVVYYDDSARRYYVCAVADLDDLCALMASDDDDVSRDAYSHWCAGSIHAEFEAQAAAEAAAKANGGAQ